MAVSSCDQSEFYFTWLRGGPHLIQKGEDEGRGGVGKGSVASATEKAI